jgi:hypothetical protein
MAKQFIKKYKSGMVRDKNKPLPLDANDRKLTKDKKPAGKDTCNAKLTSRDGYCKQKGVAEFARCRHHGGKSTLEAFNVFKKSLGFEQAVKMEALIQDTLNMDNELASTKVLLTTALEDWQRAHYVLGEYLDNVPIMPDTRGMDEDEMEDAKDMYKKAVALHYEIIKTARMMESNSYLRAEKLTKVLVDGVSKNKKLTEGAKFTMDIKQIRGILKMQLEVMAANCSECPNLKNVIKMMRERSQDIMIDPNMSKESRKALGAKKYAEQLDMVSKIGDAMNPEDAEYEEED